jgi:hypothetical protein
MFSGHNKKRKRDARTSEGKTMQNIEVVEQKLSSTDPEMTNAFSYADLSIDDAKQLLRGHLESLGDLEEEMGEILRECASVATTDPTLYAQMK